MDQLYYFTSKASESMETYKTKLNDCDYFDADATPLDSVNDENTVQEDDYDDDADNDDNDIDEPIDAPAAFGDKILFYWGQRKETIKSDFAIAGWFLCPLDEVMQHCLEKKSGIDRLSVENVIDKLYFYQTDDELGKTKDTFWMEFEEFHNKSGKV